MNHDNFYNHIRTTLPVDDGRITGRNGHFDMESLRITTSKGLTFLDGIGKSGKVLNAGMSMDASDFACGAVRHISDTVLIQELRNRNYALSIWQVDDVRHQAIELNTLLTDDEIKDIVRNLDDKHDANLGINWSVIICHIDDYSKSYEGDEAIVTCTIMWYNNNETEQVQIMIGEEDHLHLFKDVYDENIFYYVMDEEEFTKLQHDNDGEFEIVNVHEIRNY